MAARSGEDWMVQFELETEQRTVVVMLDPDMARSLAKSLKRYAKVCLGEHVSQLPAVGASA
jgi:hypothetical protein